MRLHANGIDRSVGPATRREIADYLNEVAALPFVGRVHAMTLGHCEALGHRVDADHGFGAAMERYPCGNLANRPKADHDHGTALWDVRVLNRLPRGGQNVGEVEVALVR